MSGNSLKLSIKKRVANFCLEGIKDLWIFFFCWKLLGFIPGGAPFSQLNRGVKDAVSATTKKMFNISKLCKNVH